MPFAVIAVTLLMLSVVCGAVMADYERASDNTESVGKDAEAIERASAGITRHIERGLGEIILQVSRDPSMGGIQERMEEFDRRAEEWFGFQFPVVDSGVRAESPEVDIGLRAESMRNLDGNGVNGGHTPSYLRGVGTVEVDMVTSSGSAHKVLQISTDGSYALPLAAEQGSLFESMAGGNGFTISQMMEYQLSCLAQSRVINGYGADNAGPGMGTGDIITPGDVREAYSNALSAIGLICFRDTGEGLEWYGGVDLADVMVEEDGFLVLDMNAFFAQSLFACIDEMALRWFEYFSGDTVSNILTAGFRALLDVGHAIGDLLKGHSVFGAQSYIREAMKREGYSESDWTRPGEGITWGTVNGKTFYVDNPTTDIMEESWVKHFKLNRKVEGNYVMDSMRDVLRSAAVKAGERSGYDTVRLSLDPSDAESFSETLSKAYEERSQSLWDMFQGMMSSELRHHTVADPFCVEVADRIASESHRFLHTYEFESDLRNQICQAFPEYCDDVCDDPGCEDAECDDPSHRLHVEDLYDTYGYQSMVRDYENSVIWDLGKFGALRHQPGDSNIIDDLVSGIVSVGLQVLGIVAPVEETMDGIIREMCDTLETNPHSGIAPTPGSDGFRLQDDDGNTTGEKLRIVSMESDPAVTVGIDRDRSMHNIGFDADVMASFTTVFKVHVRDAVSYSVNGSGSLAESMGLVTTVYGGTFHNGFDLEIPVVSGWALDGVDYAKSTTFAKDLMEMIAKFLAPILEPLRMMLETFRNAVTLVVEKALEVGRYIADAVSDLYGRMMEAVYRTQAMIENRLDDIFGKTGMSLYNLVKENLQSMEITVFGFRITFATDAGSWFEGTKSLLKLTVEGVVAGLDMMMSMDFKCKGSLDHRNICVAGAGSLAGEDWSVKCSLDPLMKLSRHILTVAAVTPTNEISVIVPELIDYHDISMAVSDAVGMTPTVIIPFLGAKATVDAGFQVRYSDPQKKGLVINEFESNPPGKKEAGKEWVELLNNSPVTVDLTGYTLTASSDWKNKRMTLSGSIGPGEYLVVHPDFSLVNTGGKYTKNGEALTLKDPMGDQVDKTPTLKDDGDDDNTWHRLKDGATDWTYGEPSQGASNRGKLDGVLPKNEALEIAKQAVSQTFDDVPEIDSAEKCREFAVHLVKNCVDILIERLTGTVIDASVFARITAGDATGTTDAGFTLSLRADRTLASDVLKYIAGKLYELITHAENPWGIDPLSMFTENIGIEATFDAGIGAPDLFGVPISENRDVRVGVTFRTNVAAMTHLFGKDTGRPELVCGVRMPELEELAFIPPRLDPDPDMMHDLWLMKVTVTWI